MSRHSEQRLDRCRSGWDRRWSICSKVCAGGAAVKVVGLLGDVEAAAEAGEQRLLQGQVAAEGVDGGDAKLRGQVEQIPAERLRAVERAAGEASMENSSGRSARFAEPFQVREDAVAHFGGGGVGEGDGDDLAGLVDLGEQAEKAVGEQVGFARAGRGLDEDGAGGIEGAIALG